MKKILSIIAILFIGVSGFAQPYWNTKNTPQNAASSYSIYGHQAINYQPGTLYTLKYGTVNPISVDTLVSPAAGIAGAGTVAGGTDSGYVQFTFNTKNNLTFDLAVTKLSGTLAGAAILYGSLDNATWFAITGNTTYCAGCQGASATITNTTGTKHYQWYVPSDAVNYPYYMFAPILSGTCTATFSGTANYKN